MKSSALPILTVLCATLLALAVFTLRLSSVLSEGSYSFASGVEGVGIYGALLTCEGVDIYGRLESDPNAHIFNLAFYWVYGFVAGIPDGCASESIMTMRLTSITMACGLPAAIFGLSRLAGVVPLLAAVLATVAISPIVGWWAFAIRPDIAGFLAMFVALGAASHGATRKHLGWITFAVIAALIAYLLKQTYLSALAWVTFFFLLSPLSRTMKAWTFCLASVAGALIGMTLLDTDYVTHAFGLVGGHGYEADLAIANLKLFLIKAAPYLAATGLAIWYARDRLGKHWLWLFGLAGFFFVYTVAASKFGAGDYYFFPVLAFMLVTTIRLMGSETPRIQRFTAGISALPLLMLAGLTLLGAAGTVSMLPQDPDHRAALKSTLAEYPKPRFVLGDSIALPTHSGPAELRLFDDFVYRHGVAQQSSALQIQDLINQKHFSVIAVDPAHANFDLWSYKPVEKIGKIQILEPR